jgi:hypothetical protein
MSNRLKQASVIVATNKVHDRTGVAVQLSRAGSGDSVLYRLPEQDWYEDMQEVADVGGGNLCIVMHPSHPSSHNIGILIALVPGRLDGHVNHFGHTFERPRPGLKKVAELCNYGSAGGTGFNRGDLVIESSLEDALTLRDALTRVIKDAKRLRNKRKRKISKQPVEKSVQPNL